ncbi:MAG TPA: hypothetical protein VL357_05365 [Rariglobus sp.]|jgi:hypothetical protein|nr:hypothetical protein [Rariglobus sp.]
MKPTCRHLVAVRKGVLCFGGATLLALVAGCRTYQEQSSSFVTSFHSSNIALAVATVDKGAKDHEGTKDEIVWKLEQGATLRTAALADPALLPPPPVVAPADAAMPPPAPPTPAEISAGYIKRSIAAFDQAEDKVNTWEEQARIKVGSQSFSLVTNLANLPYRGRAYDKVMLDTYNALNYLQLGEFDPARVSLNRALQRQRDAVELNRKYLAEAQREADKARAGEISDEKGKSASYDVDKARTDPGTAPALSAALAESTAPIKAYGDYVNPFAVFLDGLFFTVRGENGADWERGRKSFERLAALVPNNPYVAADRALGAAAAEGKIPEGLTYVIFETGTGPARDQIRIDIPTFLVSNRLAYVGAAFPKLVFNSNYIPALSVTGGGRMLNTATVASMDGVVANDFKNEWPTILTKTLIGTATKAIIQAITQKQLSDQNPALGLLGGIGMTVLNYSTNIADTRTWLTLPKEFQYARLATPANRQLALTAGTQTKTITLDPGAVNVVYVKSVSTTAPLLVSQFVLK